MDNACSQFFLLHTLYYNTNWAWENTTDDIKTSTKESLSLHEMNRRKAWFDEECLGFFDQRKEA